jgi:hypothetical protein
MAQRRFTDNETRQLSLILCSVSLFSIVTITGKLSSITINRIGDSV